MSFFDEVQSFFGAGEQQADPITVPVAGGDAPASDPNVMAAQARFDAACQVEDELAAREQTERKQAESRQSGAWQEQLEEARAAARSAREQATLHAAKERTEGSGDLHPAEAGDRRRAVEAAAEQAERKVETLSDFDSFRRAHPVERFMDQGVIAEVKHAGLMRMQAHDELEAAKRAAAAAAAR